MAGLGLDTTSDIIPQERKKKTRFETAQVALLIAMIVFSSRPTRPNVSTTDAAIASSNAISPSYGAS